jgi:alanine racemase
MTSAAVSTPVSAALNRRTVDHDAIRRNIARIRAASGVKLMAVVKADAFGHGAVDVARTALSAGAEWLGVAAIEEALELRAAGIDAPLLVWLVDPGCPIAEAVRAGVVISCANRELLEAVIAASFGTAGAGTAAEVHLELDTGMARGGSAPEDWADLCAAAAAAERAGTLRVTGLWSHLADASDPDPSSVSPAIERFEAGVGIARAAGLDPADLHLANSAGALEHPPTVFTMVRCAASVYGIETVVGRTHGLEYAIRLVSRVIQLRKVAAGTGVGYDHTFVAPHDTVLALVPMGYADGVPRALGGRGEVVIGGRRLPIVGTISMDQLVVDVGDAPVALGDEVLLLGDAAAGEPDPAEWARIAGTLPHDILTGFGARVERKAVNLS